VTEEHGDQKEQVEVEVDGIEVEVEVVEAESEGPDEATEEYEVKGEDLLSRVKELVREGNVRRITIRTEQGNTLIEIPPRSHWRSVSWVPCCSRCGRRWVRSRPSWPTARSRWSAGRTEPPALRFQLCRRTAMASRTGLAARSRQRPGGPGSSQV